MRCLPLTAILLLAAPMAWAQQKPAAKPASAPAPAAPGPATSAGPGRITCTPTKTCTLGIGSPAKLFYTINVDALPGEDRERLAKGCGPKGTIPCIVTISGTEMGDPIKLKAGTIKWHN